MGTFDDVGRKFSEARAEAWRMAQRAGNHVVRNIPGQSAPREKLKKLDSILQETKRRGGIANVPPTMLKAGAFDFTWMDLLTAEELVRMRGEWVAKLQFYAAVSRDKYHHATSALDGATRTRLLANVGNDQMWDDLHEIKKAYQKLAKSREGGFFDSAKQEITQALASLQDGVRNNALVGVYLTYFEQAQRTFDQATVHGTENELQEKIIAAGGLYRIAKGAYDVTVGTVKMVATFDASAAKKVVRGAVDIVNHLGGMVKAVSDMAQAKEADLRRLSAQYGLDKEIEETIDYAMRKLLGNDHRGTIRQQVIHDGPSALRREADIYADDLLSLRKELRHSLHWMEVWERDLEEMKLELDRVQMQEQEIRRQQVSQTEAGPTAAAAAEGLIATIGQARKKYSDQAESAGRNIRNFKQMMSRDLRRLDDFAAAVETRRSIARQQVKAAEAGMQYTIQRTLAMEAAKFDRSKLREVMPNLDAPGRQKLRGDVATLNRMEKVAASEVRASQRSVDRIAREMAELNLPPSDAALPDLRQAITRAAAD